MKNRAIVGLLLVYCVWGAAGRNAVKAFREIGSAAQVAPRTCDRECLRGKVTQLLSALLKHDVSGLRVADMLRVTEDAVEKPLAKVGLVGTVTRLRGFRQDISTSAPAWRAPTSWWRRLGRLCCWWCG